MFPIHCNNCSKIRDAHSKLSFQLTRCQHIICGDCVAKSTDGKYCPVCKRPQHGMLITENMTDNMSHYFMDPSRLLKMYKTVSKFQSEQRNSYYTHFRSQQLLLYEKEQKLSGYIKMEEQLRQQIDVEKKKIVKLQDYIAYYDRWNDEAILQNTSYSSSDISSTTRGTSRPRTPSFSTTVSSLSENDDNQQLNDNVYRKSPKQRKSRPSKKRKLKTNDKATDVLHLDFLSI